MKSVQKGFFFKILQVFSTVFTLLYILSYTLLYNYMQEIATTYKIEESLLLSQVNAIFILIAIVFLILLFLSFFYIKKLQHELEEDIESLEKYVLEISEHKNYEATLHIKHYLEFLSISVTLKNIIKRLKQKEKKASKK